MELRKVTKHFVFLLMSAIMVGSVITGCSSDEFGEIETRKTFATRSTASTEPGNPNQDGYKLYAEETNSQWIDQICQNCTARVRYSWPESEIYPENNCMVECTVEVTKQPFTMEIEVDGAIIEAYVEYARAGSTGAYNKQMKFSNPSSGSETISIEFPVSFGCYYIQQDSIIIHEVVTKKFKMENNVHINTKRVTWN